MPHYGLVWLLITQGFTREQNKKMYLKNRVSSSNAVHKSTIA